MNRTVLIVAATLVALAGCDLFKSPQQRIDRAAGLIEKGDYSTAAIELRNALTKDPDNARGRLLLARTEFWAGDVPAADEDLRRAVKAGASPGDTARLDAEIKRTLGQYAALARLAAEAGPGLQQYEQQMFLGYAQLGLHQVDAARRSFQKSVSLAGPGLPLAEARTAQAAGQAAGGDIQGALTMLDGVIRSHPEYRPAVLAKGNLLLQRGNYALAESVLAPLLAGGDQASLSIGERVNVLTALGDARLAQHRLTEAQQSVDQLAVLRPGTPIVAYMQGRLDLANGKTADAVAELQRSVRDAPGFLAAHVMLGLAYMGQGNAAQAEAEFQRALDAAPDNVEVRKLLAQAKLRQGRADSAAEVLAPALAADVQDPGLYALAGRVRLMQGDREQGDALLERSLAEAPDDPEMRLEMAETYLATGDTNRALKLLATVPDDVGGESKRQMQFLALAAGKDHAAAKVEIEALVKSNPGDVRLLNIVAAWLAYEGDVAGARAYLQQALAVAPKDSRTLANVGGLEAGLGHDDEARRALEAARTADPRNGQAYLGLARLAEKGGDGAGAARLIAEWRKADPKAVQPRLLLARAAFHDRKPALGHNLVDEALSMAPNSAAIEGAAGQVLMEAGLYDEALGHFRKAADLDTQDPRYLLGAARAQLAQEQRQAARDSLVHALDLRPNWAPAVILLAQLELREQHADAALALADELKKATGSAPVGFLLEGDIRLAAGQPELAAKAYAQATRLRPTAEAAIGESRARRIGRLSHPADPLLVWLARSPDDTRARLELAQTYQAAADLDHAVGEYERVLQLEPENLLALNNLAWLYGERGEPRGEVLARRALNMAPGSGPIADTLGWILLKEGKIEESLKILRQAYDLDKKNGEIAYHYGAALVKAGSKDEARSVLEDAIKAGNGAPWVSQAQQVLLEAG